MKSNPYMSLILPVYMVEPYIEECVQSIVSQNYDDCEIIFVDDGSPDNCPLICDKYAEKYTNIKVIHKENGGLSDARNTGMKYAKGKYILFIDSDDYIKPDSLRQISEFCKSYNEPDVVFLHAEKVFPNGKIVQYDKPMDNDELQKGKENAISYLASRSMYPASAWIKSVKRNILIENEIEFKVDQLSEDYEWTLKLIINAETFAYCDTPYYLYRQGRIGSITNSVSDKHFSDFFDILNCFVKKADETSLYRNEILSFAAYIYRTMLWYAKPYYKNYKSELMRYRYLLHNKKSREVQMMDLAANLCGIGGTIFLLEIYKKIRQIVLHR